MDAATEMSTDSCLLTLPTELRLQIYSYVFSVTTMPDARVDEQQPRFGSTNCLGGEVFVEVSQTITARRRHRISQAAGHHFAAILRTCKQIQAEATDILYQQTLFTVATGTAGAEMVDAGGRLRLQSSSPSASATQKSEGSPLQELTLFDKMQHVHLEVNIGKQVNPVWDVVPVTRAILATLPPGLKTTTATLRFGLMTAVTCSRLTEEVWTRFQQEVKGIPFGCIPDVEVDEEMERWSRYGQSDKFEAFAVGMGGNLRFVNLIDKIGPHDSTLRACVVQ